MDEFIVYWSFDNGKTLEHIGYEKFEDDGNFVFKRINTDTKELRKDWHLGMITDNQGNAKFYRFPSTGKTDIEDNKIYADSSIVEFEMGSGGEYTKIVGYFSFNTITLSYVFKTVSGENLQIKPYWAKTLKVIGTLQENPELLK